VKVLDPKKENGAVIEICVALSASVRLNRSKENPIRRYDIGKVDSGLWTLQERSVETLFEIGANRQT